MASPAWRSQSHSCIISIVSISRAEEPVSFWRSWGVAALCWTAMGLIIGRTMLMSDRDHANHLPYAHYFVWAAAEAFSCAMITPFLFLFNRHFPFQARRWMKRIVQYVLFTGSVLILQPVLKAPAWFYSPDRHQSFGSTILGLGLKSLLGNIQICFVLYLLSAYQNTKREARWRQLHEAELEVRVSSAELQMLRMQLHPHFLFNVLQAATVLVHENPEAAEQVLLHLSKLLRVALGDMHSLQVPLKQEIVFLEHYVEIQKQRFQERLTVHINVPLDTLSVAVPPLLLQPLVENAIQHGIGKHKGSDQVEVLARRDGKSLVLEIRNFASVLDERAEASGHGVGLKNTRARLEQMYGRHATLQLLPLLPRGVRTAVTLPAEGDGRIS